MRSINMFLHLPVIFLVTITINTSPARCQVKEDSLINFFNDISQMYLKQTSLSYNIHYTYSNESTPEKILDSTTTKVLVIGKKYYYSADSTEVFSNDSITIIVFKENKILYLAKAKPFSDYNPVSMLDSFFKSQKTTFRISNQQSEKIVQIFFPQTSIYKELSITVDESTRLINSIKYVVKTEQLAETGITPDDESKYDEYAIVNARFQENKNIDTELLNFSPSAFFEKRGNKIVGVGKYKDYTVYLGSMHL